MFDVGQHVGEMHGHTPSRIGSPLKDGKFEPVSVFDIPTDVGLAMMEEIGDNLPLRLNKEAYVVSSVENEVLVIYWYDFGYYLTTLQKRS